MNHIPLLKLALGDNWQKLPAVIQSHYQLPLGQQTQNVVIGDMHIHYPVFVTPIVVITRMMGALIGMKGAGMSARVEKWMSETEPGTLFWKRSIQSPDGKGTVFASRMEHCQGNQLIERVGWGFGLYLNLSVENNRLIYRSDGHLWQAGRLRIPIPDVMFLGHATIIETAVDDSRFELDFRIRHPLFGETYRYGGIFQISG